MTMKNTIYPDKFWWPFWIAWFNHFWKPICVVSGTSVCCFDPKLYWSIGRTKCSYYSTRVDLYSHQILLITDQQVMAWCHKFNMMTSSNGNIFHVTGPLCGEFTGPGEFPSQRPVTRSFDVFFDLRLNKRLSKQPWGWWFETPAWSLWRHRSDKPAIT